MSKLILVDGSAVLHRAYHAYPPLTTKDGRIVGAVYGVVSILLTVLDSQKPSHMVVAWDLPKPTFRHELYVGYKAQRPKADLELVEQIGLVKELIAKMGIVQVEEEGYEGDDLLGSMARFWHDAVDEILLLTGDQDTMQLVNEKVRVLLPPKPVRQAQGKVRSETLYGAEEVKARYGVLPAQIVAYKALVGDPSDNIPGALGIGPKTAVSLINEYGSIEMIYGNLAKIPEKTRVKLENSKESVLLSYALSEIKCNVVIERNLKEVEVVAKPSESLREKLLELGFKSLVKRVFAEKKVIVNENQLGLF